MARHAGRRHHRAGVIDRPNIVEDQQRRRSAESTEGAEALILDPKVGWKIEIEESMADTGEINRRRLARRIDREGAAWITASMAPREFASQLALAHAGRAMEDDHVVGRRIAETIEHLIEQVVPSHKRKVMTGRNIALKAARWRGPARCRSGYILRSEPLEQELDDIAPGLKGSGMHPYRRNGRVVTRCGQGFFVAPPTLMFPALNVPCTRTSSMRAPVPS